MPAFVQKIDTQRTSSSTTTVLTLPSPTTAGNLIAVGLSYYFGANVTSVADNKGNTYTLAKATTSSPSGLAIWYAPSIAGGASHAVTITTDTTFSVTASVLEYSGVAAASPVDATIFANGSSSAPDSGALISTAGDLVVAALAEASGGTLSAGSGWTSRTSYDDSVQFALDVEDKASTGSDHATWTTGSTPSTWSVIAVAFKAASVGGPFPFFLDQSHCGGFSDLGL